MKTIFNLKTITIGGVAITAALVLLNRYSEKRIEEFLDKCESIENQNHTKTLTKDEVEVVEAEIIEHNKLQPIDPIVIFTDEDEEDELTEEDYRFMDEEFAYEDDYEKFRLDETIKEHKKEGFVMLYPYDTPEANDQYEKKLVANIEQPERDAVLELFKYPFIQHNREDGVIYDNCFDLRKRFFGEGPYLEPSFGDLFIYFVERITFDDPRASKSAVSAELLHNLGFRYGTKNAPTPEMMEEAITKVLSHQLRLEERGTFGLFGLPLHNLPNEPLSFLDQYYLYLDEMEALDMEDEIEEYHPYDYNDTEDEY